MYYNKVGNKKLSNNKIAILKEIKKNNSITSNNLANILNISTTSIENNLKYLKNEGFIERVGSNKTGHWELLRDDYC